MVKTIKINDELHSRLSKYGTVGDTFEDVIKKLLDDYDKNNKKK
ncbi:MAG: hypothetical protein ACR2F1_11715 [Nitrososphaeraceae archaeon]